MKEPKTYKKLDSSPLSKRIDSPFNQKDELPRKKIIPSSAISGVREDLKKIFLPLLIDIFELRQMVKNQKSADSDPFVMGKRAKSPEEVLDRLKQLQNDVEESQRWCNGVILQIAKGIEEARELLEISDKQPIDPPPQRLTLLKKLLKRWHK